jgi:hypothetical protein
MKSPRGLELVLSGSSCTQDGCPDAPTITVELAEKWYSLWLVRPSGQIEPIPFPEIMEMDDCSFVDHAPNPDAIRAYADAQDFEVDLVAFELIVGRWETEVTERYSPRS